MNTIVAVTSDWGIGLDNKLLVSIPEDMKFFRTTTSGKIVVMGRKTLESFPGGRPLKNRVNIVITRDENYEKEGAIVVHSVEEALEVCKSYDSDEIFVIGGASIYKSMLQYVDTAYVTKVDILVSADTFFPNLDEMDEWYVAEKTDDAVSEGLTYRFCTYRRKVEE